MAYAIGVAEPVSIMIETFGTGTVPAAALEDGVREVFDLRPLEIIKALRLRRPIYRPTATYGHFGRPYERGRVADQDLEFFTWEQANRVEDLRLAVQRSPHYTALKATT